MQRMCELALCGKTAEAREIDAALAPLHQGMFVESNPIPAKWALYRMGMIDSGIRLPLTELSSAGQAKLEPVLRELGLVS